MLEGEDKSQTDGRRLLDAGVAALLAGHSQNAVRLLTEAAEQMPLDARLHNWLGRARTTLGDAAGAAAAHERALHLAPHQPLFRLYFAAALEQRDAHEQALLHYLRAVREAQLDNSWLDEASTPVDLRPLVKHAMQTIHRGRSQLFERLLAPFVTMHGKQAMRRVDAALRVYGGDVPPHYPDPRQRPTFFYVPQLPPAAYFDRRLFSWVESLEAHSAEIRAELLTRLADRSASERVFDDGALERENLRGNGTTPSWTGYYFHRHGERREDNCRACPSTAAALEQLPLIRIRDHSPEVLFSVFSAGTHLMPHRGVTNARSVCHLPLIVPAQCALRVGGELHEWREGRVVVFDDTYEHEAWNRSLEIRVVLIADLWNPHLAEPERAALSAVIAAIGDMRVAAEQI
jgi:aspartate beta-hydroxylase